MIHTSTDINGQPVKEILTEIHIASNLIAIGLAALLVRCVQHGASLLRGVVGIAVDVHIVHANGEAVAFEKLRTLIPADTRQGILRAEIAGSRLGRVGGAVVNLMAAEVRIDAQRTVGLAVMILNGGRDDTTGNPLVGIVEWRRHGSRIRSIEVGDIGIDVGIPVVVEIVAQLHITAILLKAHTRAVVVGAVVLC